METEEDLLNKLLTLVDELKSCSHSYVDPSDFIDDDDLDLLTNSIETVDTHSSSTVDDLINEELFYPFAYLEEDKIRVLNKLSYLLTVIADSNHADYKFVNMCISEVHNSSGLTVAGINYLNKIHDRHKKS